VRKYVAHCLPLKQKQPDAASRLLSLQRSKRWDPWTVNNVFFCNQTYVCCILFQPQPPPRRQTELSAPRAFYFHVLVTTKDIWCDCGGLISPSFFSLSFLFGKVHKLVFICFIIQCGPHYFYFYFFSFLSFVVFFKKFLPII